MYGVEPIVSHFKVLSRRLPGGTGESLVSFRHDFLETGCFRYHVTGGQITVSEGSDGVGTLPLPLSSDDGSRSDFRNVVFEKPKTMDSLQNNNHAHDSTWKDA
jgi:hypothetical protein